MPGSTATDTANKNAKNKHTQNMDKYLAENPDLTVADIQVYNINRSNYFAGTIAVCVIYGVFSLILLLITIFSPAGSQLITDTFKTFTVTFIIGMVIAIILLTTAVVSYTPKQLHQNPYDTQMCPDYWKFEETKETDITFKDATMQDQYLMEYKCVNPDTNATSKTITTLKNAKPDIIKGDNKDPADIKALYTYTTKERDKSYKAESSLNCKEVFPLLLHSVNSKNDKINNIPNALACKYAEQCGVTWTNMCPAGSINMS